MALQDPGDTLRHGAIFLSRRGPWTDAVTVSSTRWTTCVKQGVKAVVTFGPAATSDAMATYEAAIKAANDGLDYLSVRGEADVMIQTGRDDFIVWWPESTGVVMQATAIQSMGFAMFADVEVRGPDGTVKPSPPLTPIQHDAFRFIRMSRTSVYLYDSYRNMFLALECLLNDIAPQPQRGEGEGAWFKRALGVANNLVPVADLAPAGETDPIQWVYDNMYSDERSGLSHAKRDYLLPQDESQRDTLITSLEKLSDYVDRLVETHLGVTHLRSHLYDHARRQLLEDSLTQSKLYVSDDKSLFHDDDPNYTGAPVAGSGVVEAEPIGFAMVDQYLGVVNASWDASALSAITAICRTGAHQPGPGSGIYSELRGPLELGESVTRFELRVGIRVLNAQSPPRNFMA
jgi:hypothetical protein